MNGRFLLDTNAVIALLNGNEAISEILHAATWIGISILTELEFLAFPGLISQDEVLFRKFKDRVDMIDLQVSNNELLTKIISIRKSNNLKMPDAIIAASAMVSGATLLTQDKAFSKLSNLTVLEF